MVAMRYTRTGNMRAISRAILSDMETAATNSVRTVGRDLQLANRQLTVGAGLGKRLSNTWRIAYYPARGTSLGAAALVYSKAATIVSVFAEGATIKSSHGYFLAVPTPDAPKRGINNKRIKPSNFPEQRYGKLRFIYRQKGPSLLVVDGLVSKGGKRGGFRRATERKATKKRGSFVSLKGLTTVVMFILLPQVTIKRRFDLDAARVKAARELPSIFAAQFAQLNARRNGGIRKAA